MSQSPCEQHDPHPACHRLTAMHVPEGTTSSDRIEARASAAAAENERLALRKLGRRLREVHEELAQYDELIGRSVGLSQRRTC